MHEVIDFLGGKARSVLPRMLTQICRDPNTPYYGCCDRNWWHYKIRDFPSIILQQAGFSISLAGRFMHEQGLGNELNELARATCQFWDTRARRFGAFEEYYPYEQGYPPLAFSTLAVAKLCSDGIVNVTDIEKGLVIASKQLLSRFENEAANQQVAGLAALSVIRKIAPGLIPEKNFYNLFDKTLSMQKKEGWFPEYEGPDLGYLSVTMDCLWDIFDNTGDERCLTAINSAFRFVAWFVLGPLGEAGMHNSRNTDYIVPYGLVRFAAFNGYQEEDIKVLKTLYAQPNDVTGHFFDAIDDRYWCHYIGHSVFRALIELEKPKEITAYKQNESYSARFPLVLETGHALIKGESNKTPQVLISARKGGIFTAVWPDGQRCSDFGWIICSGNKQFLSHWWTFDWDVKFSSFSGEIQGYMLQHNEQLSSPLKHILLRFISFFTGRHLISFLKRILIFKKKTSRYGFERKVRCVGNAIVVEDQIYGLKPDDYVQRAPRSSKRHVASADSFHREDLSLRINVLLHEEFVDKEGGRMHIRTTYRPVDMVVE